MIDENAFLTDRQTDRQAVRSKIKFYVIIMILSFIITLFFHKFYYQNGISVTVDITSPQITDYQLFWKNQSHGFSEEKSIHIKNHYVNKSEQLSFFINESEIDSLRLDFGNGRQSGFYKLDSVSINQKKVDIMEGVSFHDILKSEVFHNMQFSDIGNDPFLIIDNSTTHVKAVSYFKILRFTVVYIFCIIILGFIVEYFQFKDLLVIRKNNINLVLLLCILFMTAVPLLFFQFNKTRDEEENRNLAVKPNFIVAKRININYSKEFENWFNDHFGGRKKFIKIHNIFEDFLHLGKSENDRAFMGRENWLYYKGDNSISLYQNKVMFSDEQITKIKQLNKSQRNWLKNKNISYYVFIAPNKEDVYGEYYRKGIHKKQQNDRIQDLMVKDPELGIIYPLQTLINHKNDGFIYYKNDTHWSEYGSYIGYLSLMDTIKNSYPNITILQPENMKVKKVTHKTGDLSNMLGINSRQLYNEEYIQYIPLNGFHYQIVDKKEKEGSKNEAYIKTINPNKKMKVIVFRDSFSSNLLPYQQFTTF